MRHIFGLALAISTFTTPALANPDAAGAKAFLEALYAPYQGRTAQPVTLQQPARYYEAKLARAIVRQFDEAKERNEAPDLNGDPICDCQDYLPFKANIAPMTIIEDRAKTVVTFNSGRPTRLEVELIATRGGWRIYDIRTGEEGLRSLLEL